MLGRLLHIAFAFTLIVTTTNSIWSHLIEDDYDPIEIPAESDAEKGEKEGKKEIEEWDDDFVHETGDITPTIYFGLQKIGTNSFAPSAESSHKLYILYNRLKLDC